MSTKLEFQQHEEFHRAAIHMSVAGAFAGLGAHVASLLDGRLGGLAAPIPLAALAGAAAYGATKPEIRTRVRELAVTVGLAAGCAMALIFAGKAGARPELLVGIFAAGFAILCARGTGVRGRSLLITLAAAAGAALLGHKVVATLADGASGMPPWAAAALAGGGFGLVALLGTLPRHLAIHEEQVEARWNQAKPRAKGELAELLGRAHALWQRASASVEVGSPARKAIEDSVVRLFDVANRWMDVEEEASGQPKAELATRLADMDKKVDATTDDIARGQYVRARGALAEQLRYVEEIETSRERVVARLHHYLAAMERLRFAVINNRSADASRLSSEVQPILSDLESLGKELDSTTEALGEVEKDEASAETN